MLVLGDKGTLGTSQHFFRFNVNFGVPPKVLFRDGDKFALLTFEDFDFALRIDFGHSNTLIVIQVFWCQVMLIFQMCFVFLFRFCIKVTFGAPVKMNPKLHQSLKKVFLISYLNS